MTGLDQCAVCALKQVGQRQEAGNFHSRKEARSMSTRDPESNNYCRDLSVCELGFFLTVLVPVANKSCIEL